MARLHRSLSLLALMLAACAEAGPDDGGDDEDVGETIEGLSNVVAKNAKNVKLIVDAKGIARIGYTDGKGTRHRVLAWGAVNAITPSPSKNQVRFKFDFAGGSPKTFGWGYWQKMKNVCGPYEGPKLPLLVTACTAPDGSHWALQSWRRLLPNGGKKPKPGQAPYELHVSHWKGPLPTLEVWSNWMPGIHLDRLFARYMYKGKGIYGFHSNDLGDPEEDQFGRNVYIDVRNPPWGSGWFRFNSGLTHNPWGTHLDGNGDGIADSAPALGGNVCLGTKIKGGPVSEGDRYRLTVRGPGVMPILRWEGPSPGAFDAAKQAAAKTIERSFVPPPQVVNGKERKDSCY